MVVGDALLAGAGAARLEGCREPPVAASVQWLEATRVGGRLAQSLGLVRQPVLFLLGVWIDLVVAFPGGKELLHQVAPRDVGRLCEQVLDVVVEVPEPALRDGVGDVVDRARHVWQRPLLLLRVARLDGELGQQCDLEVVKVLVVSRQLPPPAVLEFRLNDEPVLVLRKTVFWYLGRDRREQLRCALVSVLVPPVAGVLLVARRLKGLLGLEKMTGQQTGIGGEAFATHCAGLALTYTPF